MTLPPTLAIFASSFALLAVAAASDFHPAITPFLDQHCIECHDDTVQKGGLDLTSLSTDLDSPKTLARWVLIHDRVAKGEMPPEKRERPAADASATFVEGLATPLRNAHIRAKGTVLRRLNRQEYENTLNDTFGISVDFSDSLPPDGLAHGFDNIGDALGISMEQMQAYVTAARTAVDASIALYEAPPEVTTTRATYAKTQGAERFIPSTWGSAPDGATVFYHTPGYPTGMLRETAPEAPGRYRIKVTGYAYQSELPITFSVGSTSFVKGADKPVFGYFSFPPGQPTTIELEATLKTREMVEIAPWGLHDIDNYILGKGKTTVGYSGPGLAINHVEVEGPLTEEYPSKGHHLLIGDITRTITEPARYGRPPQYEINVKEAEEKLPNILIKLTSTLYRRPTSDADIAPFLDLFSTRIAAGDSPDQAIRAAATAVLCAPDFLYLDEPEGKLAPHALASRLSYFLNRSTPNAALREAADQGEFDLTAQAIRLMDTPHFDRFIKDFSDGWLALREIEATSPDTTLFPEFDRFLQYSSLEETRAFLSELIKLDLPATNLAKSDFSIINNRLAHHYNIPSVDGPEFHRVSLPQDSPRGGLLSQASILKVTANGTNTSPVLRGVWVLERLFGDPPLPPPPGTPGVEPDTRGAETLRQLLDKHRSSSSCNACHNKIDPPGFALEVFDPIGGYRERFRTTTRPAKDNEIKATGHLVAGKHVNYFFGPAVDASGTAPDGSKFTNFHEFRDLVASSDRALARAFLMNLLTFATGREMGFSDRGEIDAILDRTAEAGYPLRSLLLHAVTSEIFCHH